jgi:hypothetical protein
MISKFYVKSVSILVALLLSVAAWSQITTATLNGVVSDEKVKPSSVLLLLPRTNLLAHVMA